MEQNKDQSGAAVRGEAVAREYFYKVDACKADDGKSPECICWHKEGTGPLANRAHEVKHWRPAAPVSARAADAPSESIDLLYAAVMNIPCERTMSHFVTLAELRAYKEGHHAARHAAVNLVAAFKSRAADALSEPSEPASMTDVDRMRMPKRDAFIKWAKGRALDVTESKDAWGNRSFVHPHIESIWFGWFHAPSEPACKLCNDTGDMSLGPTDNFGQCSCRAADALDSQPTEPDGCAECRHTYCMSGEVCKACGDVAMQGWKGGRQPTDGGVRNG